MGFAAEHLRRRGKSQLAGILGFEGSNFEFDHKIAVQPKAARLHRTLLTEASPRCIGYPADRPVGKLDLRRVRAAAERCSTHGLPTPFPRQSESLQSGNPNLRQWRKNLGTRQHPAWRLKPDFGPSLRCWRLLCKRVAREKTGDCYSAILRRPISRVGL